MPVVTPRLLPRCALAGLAVFLAACSTSTGGGTGGSSTSVSVCAGDPRATAYTVGLSAKAADGAFKVTFMDAMPAPPSKGANTWTVQITDAAGRPVTGAKVAVKPFMPDHGHGSSITPQVMPMGTDGTYQITLLELFMPGIWQITLSITPDVGAPDAGTPDAGAPDAVVFTFCVDG